MSEPEPQPDTPTEMPPDLAAEPAVEEALAPAAEPEVEAVPPAPADATPDAAAEAPEAAEAEADSDREADAEAARAPYAVDESVLAILREEAEREAAARRADARPPEAQPDPGIAIVAAAAAVAAPIAAEDKPSARRDLLPDVEEINSTLRPSEMPAEDDPALQDMPPPQERSGGFRSGFLIVMTVAMIGAAVYMSAPSLSRMVPALAGPLDGYVGMINGLRLELDGLMRSATVALGGN
jgi:hypothetical protein